MKFIKFFFILFIGLLIHVACSFGLNKKAEKIHDKIVSLDTHTDTPFNFLDENYDVGKWNDFEKSRSRGDFPRMKAGRLDGVFMAVFVNQGIRTDSANAIAKARTLGTI
ncbi:MAG: dipeptidase [Marinilabiliales bacterium]|nr:dipeptidase [Marinilabiliales bacterium]